MKPWTVAICAVLALRCGACAQQATPQLQVPEPEKTWQAGTQPDFIRSLGFAENTVDTPVKARAKRPDLGPVYTWKGTPLWLVVEVDPAATDFTHLCVEWPKPDPAKPPLRECRPLPERPGRVLFAAPDTGNWPEDRYVVRLLAENRDVVAVPDSPDSIIGSLSLGAIGYAVGDRQPAAANGDGGGPVAGNPAPKPAPAPAFPWPPPTPTVRTVLGREAAFADATTLGAAAERLTGALHAAGYASPAFYSAPGGYALVARLEQIEADGTPKPVPMRWSADLPPRKVFSLADYFKALFSAPEGHYRVIVFIVSDQPFTTSGEAASREQAAAWLHGGLNVLPAAIAGLPLDTDHACTALIYQFRKQGFEGEVEPVGALDGAPNAAVQLQRTRIIDAQGRLRP